MEQTYVITISNGSVDAVLKQLERMGTLYKKLKGGLMYLITIPPRDVWKYRIISGVMMITECVIEAPQAVI